MAICLLFIALTILTPTVISWESNALKRETACVCQDKLTFKLWPATLVRPSSQKNNAEMRGGDTLVREGLLAKDAPSLDMDLSVTQRPAIRYLIESALKSLVSEYTEDPPSNRDEWIDRLGEALMARSDTEHEHVLSAMMANGVTSEELYQHFIPAASCYLGEKWVSDEASFVDVTTGASRLQSLFRQGPDGPSQGHILNRSVPLGDTVLMVIPQFEQHSLGAFVAADALRRHGLWVRLAIGMTDVEIATLLANNRFSMVGLSLATWKSVEKAAGLIEYVRTNLDNVPKIVIGGRVVDDRGRVERQTGADFAVMSVREAIDRCGLTAVTDLTAPDGVL